ncbi:hypothetical protein QQ045_002193 [Rhodiola kirilowii]
MAVMVEHQGEQMDDIEHNVINSSHYVKDGAEKCDGVSEKDCLNALQDIKMITMTMILLTQSAEATSLLPGESPNEEAIKKIIDNVGGEEFLETVLEIQDRHDAAKEIEKSLLELHQVFLDMAVMVEHQGEQMDDIEHYVINSSHLVKDGAEKWEGVSEKE